MNCKLYEGEGANIKPPPSHPGMKYRSSTNVNVKNKNFNCILQLFLVEIKWFLRFKDTLTQSKKNAKFTMAPLQTTKPLLKLYEKLSTRIQFNGRYRHFKDNLF